MHQGVLLAALNQVRPRIAVDDVDQCIANAVDVGCSGQGKVVFCGAKCVADAGADIDGHDASC